MTFSQPWPLANVDALRYSAGVIGIYALVSGLGGILALASTNAPLWATALAVLTATVLAVSLLGLFTWISSWRFGAHRTISLGTFVVVAGIVGAVRGLALLTMDRYLEINATEEAFTQVTNSVFSAVIWLTLIGLVFASKNKYRKRYQSILLQGAIDESSAIVWDDHPNVIAVKTNVAHARNASSEKLAAAELSDIARAIRDEIEHNIRPLSHRLWFGNEEEVPRARWSALVRDALTAFTVPVGLVSLIWLAGTILGGIRTFGVPLGIAAGMLSTLTLALLLLSVRRFIPRTLWWGLFAIATTSIISILLPHLLLTAAGYGQELSTSLLLTAILPLALAALLIATASISLAESDRRTVLTIAQDRSQSTLDRRRESSFLHNTLQSELTGIALQLEQAAKSGTREEAQAALERVDALVSRSISEDFSEFHQHPMQRLHRLSAAWKGLCRLTVWCSEDLHDDPRLPAAVHVIEEIVANAVRHGGASYVDVQIGLTSDGLRISCVSDSQSPGSDIPGIGQRFLHELSPTGVQSHQVGDVFQTTLTIE
jgi:signal transduction histidine kinase